MSGIIHFTSGKTLEISEKEMKNMPVELNGKGIRVKKLRPSGHIVPLNSTTIEYIEQVVETLPEDITITKTTATGPTELKLDKQEAKPKKSQEELLAEMMSKSNCAHEPEKMELYIQHTAKGIRYFPVCSFCGKREKYVSERKIVEGAYTGTPNEKWTEKDLATAKPWIEG